jgi:hypothetical protein
MSGEALNPNARPFKLDARLLRIAAVIVLGGLMSIIDTTIVNVAINDLSQDFNSSLANNPSYQFTGQEHLARPPFEPSTPNDRRPVADGFSPAPAIPIV